MSLTRQSSSVRLSRGLTLIELMIAMVLGLLVSAGIISVFVSTSKSSRAQEQQARLQEAGRFVVDRLTESLRMANAPYCSGSGGIANSDGSVYVDGLRAPTILATGLGFPDNTTPFGSAGYPAEPAAQYALPSYFYMRGYDCDDNTCAPLDPHSMVTDIPAMGTAVDDRVVGADVLTIRYIDPGQGWTLGSNDIMNLQNQQVLLGATIVPETGEPLLSEIPSGDQLMMYADCSAGFVYSANFDGTTFTTNAIGAGNMALPLVPGNPELRTAPKLFPFSQAFTTVTWFLQVVDDGSASGNRTGALMRRVNGQTTELARGVERLDFRFGIENSLGNTMYLTANQVDAGMAGINCPEQPPNMPGMPAGGGTAASGTVQGCLWRAIKTIEVSLLLDGQRALPSLADATLAYAYSPDGTDPPAPPDDASHEILYSDQGFAEHMIRREFSTLVSVRNHNP